MKTGFKYKPNKHQKMNNPERIIPYEGGLGINGNSSPNLLNFSYQPGF
jgi:hypothetical protein